MRIKSKLNIFHFIGGTRLSSANKNMKFYFLCFLPLFIKSKKVYFNFHLYQGSSNRIILLTTSPYVDTVRPSPWNPRSLFYRYFYPAPTKKGNLFIWFSNLIVFFLFMLKSGSGVLGRPVRASG